MADRMHSNRLSCTIWLRMRPLAQPSARSVPISRVRSWTDMSRVLATTMPPTNSARRLIAVNIASALAMSSVFSANSLLRLARASGKRRLIASRTAPA